MRGVAGFLVLSTSSCLVSPDTSAVDKPCPCPEDARCDAATSRCVARPGTCTPRVTVADDPESFRAAHVTPTTLRWVWQPAGDGAHFASYRLVLGASAADVAPPEDEARVRTITPRERPELGYLVPPGGPAGASPSTIVTGLLPFDPLKESAGRVFARLEVIDDEGCTFSTQVVAATTSSAQACGHDFLSSATEATLFPAAATLASACGSTGGACVRCTTDGCLGPEGFHLVVPAVADLASISENDFVTGSAFVAWTLGLASTEPIFFARVGLAIRAADGSCPTEPTWVFPELHVAAAPESAAERVELPLLAFAHAQSGAPLAYADLDGNGAALCAVTFDGPPTAATALALTALEGCW